MNYSKFNEIIEELNSVYEKIDNKTKSIYYRHLGNYDECTLKIAVLKTIDEYKQRSFPPIGVIKGYIKILRGMIIKDKILRFRKYLLTRKSDLTPNIEIKDKILLKTIWSFGGQTIAFDEEKELSFKIPKMIEAYFNFELIGMELDVLDGINGRSDKTIKLGEKKSELLPGQHKNNLLIK